MQPMRFEYDTVQEGDLLWVCFSAKKGVEYNLPCTIKSTSDKEIVVKYGNAQPFSTGWVTMPKFDQKSYADSPNQYPTTFKVSGEITFPVKNRTVKPTKQITSCYVLNKTGAKNWDVELTRYPVRLYGANPYHTIRHHTDCGMFDGTLQGFMDKAWQLEKERPIPRFTENELRVYVRDHFAIKWDKDLLCCRKYQWGACLVTNFEEVCFPNNEHGCHKALKLFCENSIPYLADKGWHELIDWDKYRDHKTMSLTYMRNDVLRKLHQAYLNGCHKEAISFVLIESEKDIMQVIVKELGLEYQFWETNVTQRYVIQLKTKQLKKQLEKRCLNTTI